MCIRAETTSVIIWELGDSILFLGDHAAGILHGLSNVQNKTQVCVGRSGVCVGEASAEVESQSETPN